jgi:hypothetical protein
MFFTNWLLFVDEKHQQRRNIIGLLLLFSKVGENE